MLLAEAFTTPECVVACVGIICGTIVFWIVNR